MEYLKEKAMQHGIVPPNAREFENLVIGTCLIDKLGLDKTEAILSDNIDIFYDPRNREIYRAISFLKSKNFPVDIVTVIDQLKKTECLSSAGGDGYIIGLTMGVSSSAHIEYHCRIVFEKYICRKVIESSSRMIEMAYKDGSDVFELLDYTTHETGKIHAYLSGQKPIKSFADMNMEFVDYMKATTVPGVPIPFKKLQEENQGWQNSDLIIIAARPAMGKTALALELAKHAALNDHAVHFFSLEMANIQLHKRIIANELGIASDRIRKKRFTDDDFKKVYESGYLEKLPFYYDDSLFVWEEIKARARQVAKDKKTKMIVIDYLQLIDTKRKFSTIDRVSFVSRELKMLAKELNLPIIALSQLSRALEGRVSKKPMLSDLRESGAIEQDADIIIFPYRPEYYGIEIWDEEDGVPQDTKGKALIITAKNRHCGESELPVGWNPQYQKFHDLGTYSAPYEQQFEEKQHIPTVDPEDAF